MQIYARQNGRQDQRLAVTAILLAYASLSGFLGTLFYTQPHPATAF